MRNSDPLPPRSHRSTDDLLEELCIALRSVGCSTQFLPYRPPDPDLGKDIDRVRAVEEELRKRGVDPMPGIERLSTETGWGMVSLLQDARQYPRIQPWVRDAKDGLRIALRCNACLAHEFPGDSREVRLCDGCLRVLDSSLASTKAGGRMLLYRSYSPLARCAHANDDTVLGVYRFVAEWTEGFPVGLCRECVAIELLRRDSRA